MEPTDDELHERYYNADSAADATYPAGPYFAGLRAVYEAGAAAGQARIAELESRIRARDALTLQAVFIADALGVAEVEAEVARVRGAAIAEAVAAERERCARIVEAEGDSAYTHPDVIEGIAAAIRADREPEPTTEPCYDCGRTDGGCDRIVQIDQPEPATEARLVTVHTCTVVPVWACDACMAAASRIGATCTWVIDDGETVHEEARPHDFSGDGGTCVNCTAPATEEGSNRG